MSGPLAQRAARYSPLQAWYAEATTGGGEREGMNLPLALKPGIAAGRAVTLTDCSWRRRLGLKGPAAEAWLAASALSVPPGANSWVISDGILVGRLATSEFLIEALGEDQSRVHEAAHDLYRTRRVPGVYPVVRQDLVVRLAGAALPVLLRQTCSVDFAPLLDAASPAAGALVMTSMVGVAVVAVPRPGAHGPELELWTDPSFAHYFWTTLVALAADLGGGVALDRPTGS